MDEVPMGTYRISDQELLAPYVNGCCALALIAPERAGILHDNRTNPDRRYLLEEFLHDIPDAYAGVVIGGDIRHLIEILMSTAPIRRAYCDYWIADQHDAGAFQSYKHLVVRPRKREAELIGKKLWRF